LGKWPIGDLAFGISYLLRRQGHLHVSSVFGGTESQQLKGPAVVSELRYLLDLLTLCWHFSKKPFPVFLEETGYSQEDVLIQEPKAGILKPAFTILVNHKIKTFLLLIRGTHSIKDTLTAATGAVVPFHHTVVHEGGVTDVKLGYAHCGMVAAARWIAKLAIPVLLKAFQDHPDYKLQEVQELSRCFQLLCWKKMTPENWHLQLRDHNAYTQECDYGAGGDVVGQRIDGSVPDAILWTQSREFRRLAPVSLPEDLPEILSEISFGASFEHPRRHVPPVLCDQLLVRFVPLPFILLTFPFPPYYMSSRPQTADDAIVPKFDMHVYTFVLTPDEVTNLVAEYAIPSDLHPCVLPSDLTMNRLPVDKIVLLGLNRLTMFEIYCRSLEMNPYVNLFRAFYKLNKQGHWFSFERRSGKGGQDSSVADPPPTGVRDEDIRRLCEHVIDLRPVHSAILYAVGLTTIWKHVGHHPVFKYGEGNVATSMSEFLKFPVARGVRVGKGTTLADNERVVEYETERVLAAKQKAQAAKDRAVGKRSVAEGTTRHTKKKKRAPTTFAMDDSEEDDSTRTSSETHHSASPLNMIIPDDANSATGGGGVASQSVRHEEDDADHGLENVEEELHHDAGDEQGHQHASGSFGHVVSSSYGGSARLAFPKQNPVGDGAGSFLRAEAAQSSLFVPAWKLITHSILNDAESCRDMMIHLSTPASDDYGDLYDSHRSCGDVSNRLTETQNQLVDVIRSRNKLADDHKNLQQEHLGCAEERIKRLEEELASKSPSLIEAESSIGELKGDLERLTVDLSQAEIVRHNYVRQLLLTTFRRLLSSNEYKKSLSDVFNQAIVVGWSEGVKVERTHEEAEAILATASDYDPGCKDTFMSAFDSLFTQSYPYVEKLTESFHLPLRDLQNMWPKGTGPTLSGNAAEAP
nr:mono-/di-acylglycerol lipase, lipase, class 3 [Tanacetum cinerariifolium]